MATYPIIKNPQFVDLEKTKVRMTLVQENGTESVAELTVPANKERGINEFWDRIMDEFDVEKMRKDRNNLETRMRQDAEMQAKKRKATVENEKLKQLFDMKMAAFNLPFVASAADADKAAVRRAPTPLMLNLVVTQLAVKYLEENNMSFLDLFDLLDDLQDQQEAQKTA